MRPFTYEAARTTAEAFAAARGATGTSHVTSTAQYLAGGTTLLDLMKLDVMRPERVIDVNPLAADPRASRIGVTERGLRFGSLVRMAEAANHEAVKRNYPVLAQTLSLAASSGLRNMASLGGNMLQRTRCNYFRDTSFAQCNKREPGSGCAALDGINRAHAVLGASDQCIAAYPGDFAQSLMVLDAVLEVQGPSGSRAMRFADLHLAPGTTPDVETTLKQGELITAINVPASPDTRRSIYVKVRDRASYAFALASAAVVLDLAEGRVRHARIALGGVASVPWRANEAEQLLQGKPVTEETATAAADAAFAGARTRKHNAFKVPLGKQVLIRALLEATALDV